MFACICPLQRLTPAAWPLGAPVLLSFCWLAARPLGALFIHLFRLASLRIRLGLTAGWCDLPASLSAGHGDRRDRLYLPAWWLSGAAWPLEESAGRGAADLSLVPNTASAFPPPRPGDCHLLDCYLGAHPSGAGVR